VSDDQLGAIAYGAYSRTLSSAPALPWEHLSNRERDAWFSAINALYDAYEPAPIYEEAFECEMCGNYLVCIVCHPIVCSEYCDPVCSECGEGLICSQCASQLASTDNSSSPDAKSVQ
jgi:hypothetical protein